MKLNTTQKTNREVTKALTSNDSSSSTPQPLAKTTQAAESSQYPRKFEATEDEFSVTRLLGLSQPLSASRSIRVGLTELYQTRDPRFTVSWLLGLLPRTQPSRNLTRKIRHGWTDAIVPCIRYVLGEEPWPIEEGEGQGGDDASDGGSEESDETEEQKTQRTQFLDMAQSLEGTLHDVEERDAQKPDSFDNDSVDGLSPEDCDDDDPSRIEWLRQKRVEYAENLYMDRLMSLPGLEEVKAFFLRTKAKLMAATRRGMEPSRSNLNVIFSGNQGTGKSLVSMLYARYLRSQGVVKRNIKDEEDGIYITSGSKLGYIERVYDDIEVTAASCGGCIILVEDAHQVDDEPWELFRLYRMTTELKGNIVWIFNGEPKGLAKYTAVNAQLSADLPTVKLDDYGKEELRMIFASMLRTRYGKKMQVEGGMHGTVMDGFLSRVLRSSAEASFANIWALRKAYDEASERQMERFRQARSRGEYLEDYLFTSHDLLGEAPDVNPESSKAWNELQELVGLETVKEDITSVLLHIKENHERELRGEPMLPITTSRVFLGSPGTGKTTVAKLYGRILSDFGILSKGDVVVKNATDLIGKYLGWSEIQTKAALEEAKGCVLIIDNADMLDPKNGDKDGEGNGIDRTAIIDTLVAEVSGEPGEDRCIILCGYEASMERMFQNANPGLARRFPLDQAFVFSDFDTDALEKILRKKAENGKIKMTAEAREVAMEMLKRAAMRPNFGNGGEVDNVLTKGVMARTKRVMNQAKEPQSEKGYLGNENRGHEHPVSRSTTAATTKDDIWAVQPQDFDANWDRSSRSPAATRELFKDLIGYEDIIARFESYQYICQGMRLRNVDPRPYIPFTFVFKGPPGTGKTTTARKLGQIFYDMGFLSAPDVVECSATALIGEYCGQTGPKTLKLLESALGKVLFIDEAYRLAGGDRFDNEAISELVDAVTKEKFQRKMIIVLAGYEEDMDRLMKANKGMRSRFATEINFTPMRGEQCLEKLRRHVTKVGITIQPTTAMDAATRNDLLGSLTRLTKDKDWASGRSVETLGDKVIGAVFKEVAVKGYTGEKLDVTGRELMSMLGMGGLKNGTSLRVNGGGYGASQVMTLKDLGNVD